MAGGAFSSADGIPAQHIARWDGQQWAPIGAGVKAWVYRTLQQGSVLLAGGAIQTIYETYIPALYAWDGAPWSDLGVAGGGQYGSVAALVPDQDSVWVSGSFSTVGGLPSPYLARLFLPCYPNCDCSTTPPVLNAADFTCFLNRFAAGDPDANCDGSTTPPVLNVNDFTCFLNKFSAGCS